MKFEGKYSEIRSDCISARPVAQIVVKTTVPNTGKLLSAQSSSVDAVAKNIDGSLTVEGKVEFRLNTLNDDGKLDCETYFADYSKKLEDMPADFTPSFVLASVMETEYEQIGENVIVSSLIELNVWGAEQKAENLLVNSVGAYTKGGEITCTELKDTFSGTVELSEEFATGERIGRPLFFEARACTKSMTAGEDRVNICGNVYVTVVLDGERGVVTKSYNIPFNDDIEAKNVETGDGIFGNVNVVKTKLICTDENDNVLRFEIVLSAKGATLTEKKRDVICDVFSTTENVEAEYADVCQTKIAKGIEYSERLGGIFTTANNEKEMRDVIAVSASGVTLSKVMAEDGYIVAEGLLNTVVLFSDYDDQSASIDAELPFVVKLNEIGAEAGNDVCMDVNVVDLSARIRREREVELNCDLRFFGYMIKNVKTSLIKGVKCSEKPQNDRAAIGIYYVEKGESIWDVAKGLCCSPEDVQTLNPNLTNPLKGGERVTIFRRLD